MSCVVPKDSLTLRACCVYVQIPHERCSLEGLTTKLSFTQSSRVHELHWKTGPQSNISLGGSVSSRWYVYSPTRKALSLKITLTSEEKHCYFPWLCLISGVYVFILWKNQTLPFKAEAGQHSHVQIKCCFGATHPIISCSLYRNVSIVVQRRYSVSLQLPSCQHRSIDLRQQGIWVNCLPFQTHL